MLSLWVNISRFPHVDSVLPPPPRHVSFRLAFAHARFLQLLFFSGFDIGKFKQKYTKVTENDAQCGEREREWEIVGFNLCLCCCVSIWASSVDLCRVVSCSILFINFQFYVLSTLFLMEWEIRYAEKICSTAVRCESVAISIFLFRVETKIILHNKKKTNKNVCHYALWNLTLLPNGINMFSKNKLFVVQIRLAPGDYHWNQRLTKFELILTICTPLPNSLIFLWEKSTKYELIMKVLIFNLPILPFLYCVANLGNQTTLRGKNPKNDNSSGSATVLQMKN